MNNRPGRKSLLDFTGTNAPSWPSKYIPLPRYNAHKALIDITFVLIPCLENNWSATAYTSKKFDRSSVTTSMTHGLRSPGPQ
uniref:Uncharacterized protein n=1 Tax=Babesia bovis TaxID=5865 RepID=S6B9Z2_BABBO|nr:hypothetical protein [Babesia bovis]